MITDLTLSKKTKTNKCWYAYGGDFSNLMTLYSAADWVFTVNNNGVQFDAIRKTLSVFYSISFPLTHLRGVEWVHGLILFPLI